jgi:hypothetical protein
MDWDTLVGAAVGACAALVGVLITQRSARRVAHEDRVWLHRAEAYEAAWVWSDQRIRLIRDYAGSEDDVLLDRPLESKHQAKIFVYGTPEMRDLLKKCQKDATLAVMLSDEASQGERRDFAVHLHTRLRAQIESEAGRY